MLPLILVRLLVYILWFAWFGCRYILKNKNCVRTLRHRDLSQPALPPPTLDRRRRAHPAQ